MALHELLSNDKEVNSLLTTVTEDYNRISIHGVRTELLMAHSDSIEIHLEEVMLSKASSDADYETKMKAKLAAMKAKGFDCIGFGDIFLDWLKRKRIELAESAGMECTFPIWNRDTAELAETFISLGYKAVLTCIDSKVLDKSFAGREFDERLLADLPEKVDPCGENGEFHSFVYDGPIFKKKINFEKGDIVLREKRFYYCDLIQNKY